MKKYISAYKRPYHLYTDKINRRLLLPSLEYKLWERCYIRRSADHRILGNRQNTGRYYRNAGWLVIIPPYSPFASKQGQALWMDALSCRCPKIRARDSPSSTAGASRARNISVHTYVYRRENLLRWARLHSKCRYSCHSNRWHELQSDGPDDKYAPHRHGWCRNDSRYRQSPVPNDCGEAPPPKMAVTTRSAAMNYQEAYLPIVLIETACLHPANGWCRKSDQTLRPM